jgi:PGRS repeats
MRTRNLSYISKPSERTGPVYRMRRYSAANADRTRRPHRPGSAAPHRPLNSGIIAKSSRGLLIRCENLRVMMPSSAHDAPRVGRLTRWLPNAETHASGSALFAPSGEAQAQTGASDVTTLFGTSFADPVMAIAGQIPFVNVFIGNGANGTAAHPDGFPGGMLAGNGGNGFSPTTPGTSAGNGARGGLFFGKDGNGGAGGAGGAGGEGAALVNPPSGAPAGNGPDGMGDTVVPIGVSVTGDSGGNGSTGLSSTIDRSSAARRQARSRLSIWTRHYATRFLLRARRGCRR